LSAAEKIREVDRSLPVVVMAVGYCHSQDPEIRGDISMKARCPQPHQHGERQTIAIRQVSKDFTTNFIPEYVPWILE
jgi:hypothetical protein